MVFAKCEAALCRHHQCELRLCGSLRFSERRENRKSQIQMKTNSYTPDSHVHVRGTELLASDTRQRYREKIARITLDSMVQFVGLLDAAGTVLEINQVALDAIGINLSDVEGRPFWTTFWWQVSEEVNATLRDAILRASQGEFVRWDTPIYGRAGGTETIIIDVSLRPVKDEQGNVIFIAAEWRDITIRRQWEEALRASERKFSVAFEQSPLALAITSLDDGRLVEINEGFVRLSGYTRDEVLGRTPEELKLWIEPKRHTEGLAHLRAGESLFGVEARFRTKDGQERVGVISASLIEIHSRPHVVSSVADITERKRAEEAVRESERSLSTLISNLPGFAFRSLNDETWTMVFISERVREITGYAAADFLAGRVTWDSLVHHEDVARVRADAADHIEQKTPIRIIYRIIAANGRVRWVWDRATPVFSETGEIAFWEGFVTDITERKEAEDALSQSEERFSKAFNSSPHLMTISTLAEGRYVDANDAVLRSLGYRREEMVGHTSDELGIFPGPEGRGKLVKTFNEQGMVRDLETKIQAKDGAIRTILLSAEIISLNGEKCILTTSNDITERKRVEQALLESEADARFLAEVGERIRLATNAEELLYALSRAAGDYLDVERCFFVEIDVANDRGLIRRDYCRGAESVAGEYRVSEYSSVARAEIASGRTIVNVDSRKDTRTAAIYETSYEPRGERAYVAVPLMRDGHWSGTFWVSTEEPRHWQPREVSLLETIAERGWNAVEQLRLDAELRKSEERFRTLANNMSQLAWTCDELGLATWYNQRWYEYTGASWEQMQGDGWLSSTLGS